MQRHSTFKYLSTQSNALSYQLRGARTKETPVAKTVLPCSLTDRLQNLRIPSCLMVYMTSFLTDCHYSVHPALPQTWGQIDVLARRSHLLQAER
jgi:hypothetical protein